VGVAVSPDGTRAVTGDGQEVRISNGHSGMLYAIAPSADGERLLSGCSLDGTARHWNLATGREIATLTGHNGPVYAVTFGPRRHAHHGRQRSHDQDLGRRRRQKAGDNRIGRTLIQINRGRECGWHSS
jgi:WD40 repeat protein